MGQDVQSGARWSGDAARVVDELAERQPTHLPAVPRIYEKIHGTIVGRVQNGSRLNRLFFAWSIAQGRRRRRRGDRRVSPSYWVAELLVLSRIRSTFGDRLELGLVGAAPVAPELLEFFCACGVRCSRATA